MKGNFYNTIQEDDNALELSKKKAERQEDRIRYPKRKQSARRTAFWIISSVTPLIAILHSRSSTGFLELTAKYLSLP
jgi:hypothetical protein